MSHYLQDKLFIFYNFKIPQYFENASKLYLRQDFIIDALVCDPQTRSNMIEIEIKLLKEIIWERINKQN